MRLNKYVGWLLVLAGIAVPVTYAVYSNSLSNREALSQQQAASEFNSEVPTVSEPQFEQTTESGLAEGDAIAKLSIPRLGASWQRVIYEGTNATRVLTPLGVGHYRTSSLPGQVGNFALAAHRFGSGGPFLNIDKLIPGDKAYVDYLGIRYTYEFLAKEIVTPDQTWVIGPSPKNLPDKDSSGQLLTLTSCTPIHINTHRYVVWFRLAQDTPLADN